MKIFQNKLSLKNEADILGKLSMYLSAELSLSNSLRLIEDQSSNKRTRKILSEWQTFVESGKTLAQAFERGSVRISNFGLQAARLGDKSESLSRTLKNAAREIDKNLSLRKKVAAAVSYPLIILSVTLCLIIGLMVFVFPKIIPVFETLKTKLPSSTRFLISVSDSISSHWLLILLIVFVIILIPTFLNKYSEKFRNIGQYFILRSPIVGQIIKTKNICTSFSSLHTLLLGGEHLSVALASISELTHFKEYKDSFFLASLDVSQGKSLSEFIKTKKHLFPDFIPGVLTVGERTGNIENSVGNVSEITSIELEDRLRIITAAMEPALMIFMSLVIGFIALSIILPIYGITTNFQNV